MKCWSSGGAIVDSRNALTIVHPNKRLSTNKNEELLMREVGNSAGSALFTDQGCDLP